MNLLQDIITYIRRIIKSPSNAVISDALIIDYINRFWLMDMDARLQLFDLKTKFTFQTTPGIDQYNMPLYEPQVEPGNQVIAPFPVYQGFFGPAFVNGIQCPFYTQRESYFNQWPNYTQPLVNAGIGTGDSGTLYSLTLPFFPALTGHIDMTGIIYNYNKTGTLQDPILVSSGPSTNFREIPVTSVNSSVFITATLANGQNIVVADSGQFLSDSTNGDIYGLLMLTGQAPYGNSSLPNGYSTTVNTVNYNTGQVSLYFPEPILAGSPIQVQCFFYEQGLPRSVFFYNNTITIRPSPNTQYAVELGAYLTPAAFLNTGDAIPFGYMAEYIARGAARKILSDTGDVEQFAFYEPLFREQEMLVWKRSQRQFTSTRTGTIFSELQFQANTNNYGAT